MPAVSSFQPELLEVIKTASRQELSIGPLAQKDANRLRFRLNSLRVAMRKEMHPLLPLAERITFRLIEDLDSTVGHFVVCTPNADGNFIDAIRKAGVRVPEFKDAKETPLPGQEPSKASPGAVEQLLKDFTSKED